MAEDLPTESMEDTAQQQPGSQRYGKPYFYSRTGISDMLSVIDKPNSTLSGRLSVSRWQSKKTKAQNGEKNCSSDKLLQQPETLFLFRQSSKNQFYDVRRQFLQLLYLPCPFVIG